MPTQGPVTLYLSHTSDNTHESKSIQVLCNLCILWTCRKVSCPAPSHTAPKSHIDCKGKSDKIYMKLKAHSGLLFPLCLGLFFPMYLCLLFLPYLCSLLVTRYSAYRQVPDWVGHSRDKISKRKIRKMFLIIFFLEMCLEVIQMSPGLKFVKLAHTDFLKCENCMFNILKKR